MRVRRRFIVLTAALSVALVALLAAAAFVFAPAYSGEVQHRLTESGPSARVVDLHDVHQLATAFNQDAGTPRLVVLFSPT
jgi:uncharacterized membrane protein YdfJ with MMPL/SSD domain